MQTYLSVVALAEAGTPQWTLAQLIPLAASIAVVLSLLVAARQLQLLRTQFKENMRGQKMSRSLDFMRRWNALEFARYRKPLFDFFETQPVPELAHLLTKVSNDSDFKAALRFVLNFYEEMGLAHNRNEVDKDVLYDFFEGQIKFLYEHASPFIQNLRTTQGKDGILRQFTGLREALVEKRPGKS